MPNGWEPTALRTPLRVMVVGAALETYFALSEQERGEVVLPRFRQVLAEWEELGAQVIASFCDDVLQVGPVAAPGGAWYLIFELDRLEQAAAMVQATRETVDGVRLDGYMRFEIRVGRPFWAREE